jgi:hypothetical protein
MRGQRQDMAQGFESHQKSLSKFDEIILQSPSLIPTIKDIYHETTTNTQTMNSLVAGFKKCDQNQSGVVVKEEFINAIFSSVS